MRNDNDPRPRAAHADDDAKPAVGEGAQRAMPDLARLREVEPPPSLVAGVMQRIAEPPPPSLWRWLRRPFVIQLRLTPLGVSTAALGGALALALIVTPRVAAPIAMSPAMSPATSPALSVSTSMAAAATPPTAPGVVLVRFVLSAKDAHRVTLAGSFNGWNTEGTVLEPASDRGVFVATVPLPPGIHEYMFVVDGRWVTDPAAEERRPDGFGRQNALLRL